MDGEDLCKEGIMLKGVCHFFSETGTEGGSWAFQDERFITKDVERPWCAKCGRYLEGQDGRSLRVEGVYPVTQEMLDEGCGWTPPPACPDGQHVRDRGDAWSYEGLHLLEDGDVLTIYDPGDPQKVVWQGTIALRQYDSFTEAAGGCWIHADQDGIDRETWAEYFFKEYPAELTPARKP